METDDVIDGLKLQTQIIPNGVAQLDIGGTLDWSNYHKVDAELRRIFAEKTYRIIVNLAQTKLITSAGFGCFIEALDTALKNKGNIIFVRVPSEIQDVFRILGLTRLLSFADTEQQAVTKFGPLVGA